MKLFVIVWFVDFEISGTGKSIPSQRRDWLRLFWTACLSSFVVLSLFCRVLKFTCIKPLLSPVERFIVLYIAPVLLWVIDCPIGSFNQTNFDFLLLIAIFRSVRM